MLASANAGVAAIITMEPRILEDGNHVKKGACGRGARLSD
jgi:hypothetical protein